MFNITFDYIPTLSKCVNNQIVDKECTIEMYIQILIARILVCVLYINSYKYT